MNSADLMKDPFYVPILLQIETKILEADKSAAAAGLSLTDSQIRSTLVRAQKHAEGSAPKVPDASPKDKVLADLHHALNALWDELLIRGEDESDEEAVALPAADWILSLRSVADSIRLRSSGNGSRDYLDFLEGFLVRRK